MNATVNFLEMLYDNHAKFDYACIRRSVQGLSKYSVAELQEVARRFGVVPLKPTKAAILAAMRDKIERRKSMAVRCSF